MRKCALKFQRLASPAACCQYEPKKCAQIDVICLSVDRRLKFGEFGEFKANAARSLRIESHAPARVTCVGSFAWLLIALGECAIETRP